jgi:hypothetical protein
VPDARAPANERTSNVRRVALVATVVTMLLTLVGCGSDGDDEEPEGSTDPNRIELTFEGDEAPPTERVSVAPGEEVELVIMSDEAGELHVHSDPEDVLEYAAGTTTFKLTIDQPGVVDVERHEPEALVLQLEVS